MDNLIRKIIREESEMKEMGVKVSRLAKLQPKNYLVKRTKQAEKASKSKGKFLPYQELFLEAISEIQNVRWEDLVFKPRSSDKNHYDVYFPKDIEKKLKDSFKLNKKYVEYTDREMDKRFHIFIQSVDDKHGINIYMEENRNRTHFPDGVPDWMLGLGVGIKVYRKLLSIVGFIQSSEGASSDVQKLYSNLIQRPDVNCALTRERSLIIDANLDKERKMKILGEFILEQYEDKILKGKVTLNKQIVLDGSLSNQMGRDKLQKFIDQIRQLHKKEEIGTAFSPERFGQFEPGQKVSRTQNTDDEECEPCVSCDGEGEDEDGYECDYCNGSGCKDN